MQLPLRIPISAKTTNSRQNDQFVPNRTNTARHNHIGHIDVLPTFSPDVSTAHCVNCLRHLLRLLVSIRSICAAAEVPVTICTTSLSGVLSPILFPPPKTLCLNMVKTGTQLSTILSIRSSFLCVLRAFFASWR